LLAEQRIAEDHVGSVVLIAQLLQFVGDVRDRPCAIAGEDPDEDNRCRIPDSRAGEQRIPTSDRPRRPLDAEFAAPIFGDQIPPRKRSSKSSICSLTTSQSDVAEGEAHHARFRLAAQDEVAVVAEEFRQSSRP